MTPLVPTQVLIIRHAPALSEGRMAGQRDVDADCTDLAAFAAVRAAVGQFDHLVISPAQRCVQTAATLWPNRAPNQIDPNLWEQNFGDWEDMPYADLPDLGPLTAQALADHRPPAGESFADVCARILPGLIATAALGGRVVIVAHAGTARAAIAHATGSIPAALAFQIAPLSLTNFDLFSPDGAWSVVCVNRGVA